jgi:hypothetical protein
MTPTEQQTVRVAMQYWIDHWDFECPTLFGLELTELQEIQRRWPSSLSVHQEADAMAAIGALRELLFGASTPPREQLLSILGIQYQSAVALSDKVLRLYRTADGTLQSS